MGCISAHLDAQHLKADFLGRREYWPSFLNVFASKLGI
ncbi:hypothetical protein Pint_16904 [Pistacia integerrima]|uniref:Uncharacterized protein n=1 Tax=Pistacia integerrima TaxID=434235 RepID=A0ACC0ZAR7_9ROSI|nr:hypothetical protein Pint_16904 [Pistacia integerrima]